jgi:equilibrative nucleoside transporter 1/2/3
MNSFKNERVENLEINQVNVINVPEQTLNGDNLKSGLRLNPVIVISVVEDTNDDIGKYHNGIYWRLLFLNLVILWSYQSLISAQNYYIKFFPNDNLDFWGTVAAGSSMFILHIIQLVFAFYKLGFTKRIVPGYIGYVIVAILVMAIKNKILLIIAFASVGAINTFTESPMYGIAGLFLTGSFTQAVQVGNGLAGFLNVCANTIIRLIVLLVHSKIDNDQLSFYIFMSVLIILSVSAIYVYFRLISLPPVKIRIKQQMASFKPQIVGDPVQLHHAGNEISFWELTKILKIHLFVQFYVLFISLLLWPGIPCGVTKNGWFSTNDGKDWWCSPFVILTFNLGDLIGRTMAVKVHKYFSEKTCLVGALLRTLFIIIIFYRHHIDNIFLLCLITIMGMTNGLLATITFMVRPSTIVGVNNCERAAYLMTAALYFGIASGSIFAASLALSHVL